MHAIDPRRSAGAQRAAFTLVELLVVVAIVGVLVALLLPAVQSARESARRTRCQNNLRQVGVALVGYSAEPKALPIGCIDCTFPPPKFPPTLISWVVWLLPDLEEQALFDRFDTGASIAAGPNAEAARVVLPVLLCPSADGPVAHTNLAAFTDYGGLYSLEDATEAATIPHEWLGVLVYEEPVALREIVDGLTRTAAVAEMLVRRRRLSGVPAEWANGHTLFSQEHTTPINSDSGWGNDVGGPHPGGALVAFCDGHVRFLPDSTAQPALNAMMTRAGGER